MNLPETELPNCENHANPHQHQYMAGTWRAPRQMCNSKSFVAPCALYLSQESYYLLGWAEKHLKHNSNNKNDIGTSRLVCLLQNTLYFSFAKRVFLHLISLMNTIKTVLWLTESKRLKSGPKLWFLMSESLIILNPLWPLPCTSSPTHKRYVALSPVNPQNSQDITKTAFSHAYLIRHWWV